MQNKIAIIFLIQFFCGIGAAFAQSNTPSTSAKGQKELSSEEIKEKQELGRHYYRNREYRKAIAIYDSIYWQQPSHSNYIYYTYSLFGTQDFEKAEEVVKKQVRHFPNQSRYKVDLGYVYRNLNKTKKALRIYDDLLKDLPKNEMAIKQVANSFKTRRENEYALKTYRRGQEIFDDPVKFSIDIGQLYDRMGKTELMFSEYLKVLAHNDERAQVVKYRIQNTLNDDPDNVKASYLRNALLQKVQANPDERMYAELLLWLSVQLRDFDMAFIQTKALERRFNLGGQKAFELGRLAMNNQEFDVATDAFAYAMKQSRKNSRTYASAQIERLKARFEQLTHQQLPEKEKFEQLEEEYKSTLEDIGWQKNTFELAINQAHLQAYFLQKPKEAIALLEKVPSMGRIDPVTRAKTKLKLAGILLFSDEYWEATLLYSQVEKEFPNEPVGHEAKYQNAMLSFYIGEFDWAKAKFDVLRSATSKLIANDAMEMSFLLQENMEEDSINKAMNWYAKGNLMLYQHRYEESSALFDSVRMNYPTHSLIDNILMKKATIAEENFRFKEADSLYKEIYTSYAFDLLADDALLRAADIRYERIDKEQEAMELYKKILSDYPGSIYVFDARKKYRKLLEKYGESEEAPGSALSD